MWWEVEDLATVAARGFAVLAAVAALAASLAACAMSSAVAHALPQSILALFAPRPPIPYKRPIEKRKMPPYTGVAQFVAQFEDPPVKPEGEAASAAAAGEPAAEGEAGSADGAAAAPAAAAPAAPKTKEEKRAAKAAAKAAANAEKLAAAAAAFDPNSDPKIKGDPYKTLLVSRISYETTEAKLKQEFQQFGTVKRVRMVMDTETGKPRGYAFVEFEHERDMKTAYKQGDGKKIDGRRVLVDVERGRTVRNWKPRRLGGGLGSTRAGGRGVAVKNSGRDIGFGGGGGGGAGLSLIHI